MPDGQKAGAQLIDDEMAQAVRASLRRVLASETFVSAPQLSGFLEFVVARVLEGRSSELKGYTIAVEALGRSSDFDPQADPIVRVEAGRLRRALSQYYAREGRGDAIRITIPVGAYVPLFERQSPRAQADVTDAIALSASERSPPAEVAPQMGRRTGFAGLSRLRLGALGLALALMLAFAAIVDRDGPLVSGVIRDAAITTGSVAREAFGGERVQLPVLTVMVGNAGGDKDLQSVATAFSRHLEDAVARFDDIVSIKSSGWRADADYVLDVDFRQSVSTREGFVRLRSVKDGRIVWTTSTRRFASGADDSELMESARRMAIRLAEPFGILHADYRNASSPVMRCLYVVNAARRDAGSLEHFHARTCLQVLLAKDPGFHPALSLLSRLTMHEYTEGLDPGEEPPLERALALALKAIRLAPSSARARQMMMDVQFVRGETEDALRYGHEALARNPYDPMILADLGARYVQLNRPAAGLPLLTSAIELSGGRPVWVDFHAFLAARILGDAELAAKHAVIFAADETPLSLLGRAMQAAGSGDKARASGAIQALMRRAPLFADDWRAYLARRGLGVAALDKIMAELGPGLPAP